MYLTGSRTHSLDSKVRLTLPADMRREFDDRVCLVPLKDALYGFTPEGHQAWVASYFPNGYNPRNPDDIKLRGGLTGRTVTVDVDSAGRIALGKVDESKRKALGLEGEVTVVGNVDHFEIWNTDRWEAAQAAFEENLDSLMFD
ncbi:MraZ family transcriptional regulator [Muricaecibacterium torontonense]|jgi:MraZ protein|uniref:Transcriptional regulator MraZ n=1 Tax=Muricaecibacterium torontonense TaxID=3032871 RepID=A0A4S2EZG1_9ACTN|nr:MraZ family transcriptional regulator [Muricaecibacterium torontonense]TGY61402.1 MraZ family transcriptional regulator [Muricaecibacterium torontonense]